MSETPKRYKRKSNVPKGPKAPSKRKQNKLASMGGAGTIPTTGKKVKYNKPAKARPTQYSPKGDWKIMSDGSSRRARKVSSPKNAGEQKPYAGWSKARKKR
jgi:hypothetical protein